LFCNKLHSIDILEMVRGLLANHTCNALIGGNALLEPRSRRDSILASAKGSQESIKKEPVILELFINQN